MLISYAKWWPFMDLKLRGLKIIIIINTALDVILTSFYPSQDQTFTFHHTTLFEMGFVYFRPS